MGKKSILVLGASRYYAKSIDAAKKAGYFVIAVDRNPESEGFRYANEGIACDIIDCKAITKLAEEYGIDGIIPVNDYGVPTAAFVANKLGLPGISIEASVLATNKEEMRKAWVQNGIPCPRFALAKTREEFYDAIKLVGLPCIFKPAHGIGGGSRGVIVVREKNEIDQAIAFSQQYYADKNTLVESFIQAEIEHSAEVIIFNGQPHVIAISDKIKTPLPYRVDKNVIYPTVVNGQKLKKLTIQIEDAVKALQITIGAAHVELATTKDGFVLFELGARCGGGGTPEPIVPYVTGIDEFVETVRVLVGDKPYNLKPTRNYGCNYHFLTPKPGVLRSISGVDSVRKMEGILDVEVFVKPGETVLPVTVGTQRAGFIIAAAATRDQAYELGKLAEAKIHFEYKEK